MVELGKVLYGSNNYNLDGPESDKDYKIFLAPSFQDLYYRRTAEKTDLPRDYDSATHSVMDIRKFDELVRKGNLNVSEYLFSTYVRLNSLFLPYFNKAVKLYEDGYLALVWDNWFSSLKGTIVNSLRRDDGRKNTVRACYFIRLAMELIFQDFHMTEDTWRSNLWTEQLRRMRFDEGERIPSQQELYNSLNFLEKYAKECLDKAKNNLDLTSLQNRSLELLSDMQQLVRYYASFEEETV